MVDPRGAYPYTTGNKAGVTEYTYDGRGMRDTRTTYVSANGAGSSWTTLVEDWDYDLSGRLVTHTDLAGNDTVYSYDSELGRLESVATGSTSDASYRVEHLRSTNWGTVRDRCFDDDTTASDCWSEADASSALVAYRFDGLGRRVEMHDPRTIAGTAGAGITTFTYRGWIVGGELTW